MRYDIDIRKGLALAVMMLIVILIVRPAVGAAATERMIEVQHVRLIHKERPDILKGILEEMAKLCTELGTPLQMPPPGVPINEIIMDVYYAPGATTIDETRKSYGSTANCKLDRQETRQIDTWTILGACSTKPDRKLSTGYCDVDIASLTRLPDKKFRRNMAELKGATTMIAGHSCTYYEGAGLMISRFCIARGGAFAKVTNFAFSGFQLGVMLKKESSIAGTNGANGFDEEATEIHTDVMIPITTLLPQLSGKYKVMSSTLPITDKF